MIGPGHQLVGVPPGAAGPVAEKELQASLKQALVAGRWAIFLAEMAAICLRLTSVHGAGFRAELALGVLVLYHVLTLLGLYRLPPGRVPALVLLVADMVTVAVLVTFTGGISSPFAGLYYLVVLTSAIYYDLAGSLAVALAASAVLVGSSMSQPRFWRELMTGEVRTQTVPYLILMGALSGLLVGQLKRLHIRRVEFEERLWSAQLKDQLRQREAAVAREIQRASLGSVPAHPTLEVAVAFEPADEVGGDFYAFFTSGERLGVIVGDVSGKGVPAALVSTTLCHLVHWLQPMGDPDHFLDALNRDLYERLPDSTFASMAFALFDPPAGRVVLYNAGHLPPLLVQGDGLRFINNPNLPLGAVPDAEFVPVEIPFGPSDLLLLYSDGLVEVRAEDGRLLSLEGLEALVRRQAGAAPEALLQALGDGARRFGAVRDDLTLVAIRHRQ